MRDLVDELEHIEWCDTNEIAQLLALEPAKIPLTREDKEEGNQMTASDAEYGVINPVEAPGESDTNETQICNQSQIGTGVGIDK